MERTLTVGERLSEARSRRQYTLAFVSQSTGIPVGALESLEAGDYRRCGSRIYAERHGERYAAFLGVFDETIRDAICREWEVYAWEKRRVGRTGGIFHKIWQTLYRKHGFMAGVAAVFLVIAGYMFYELSFLMSRPELALAYPPGNYATFREPFADIRGSANQGANIFLNNRPVRQKNGQFQERLYLAAGANRIIVEAINDRGKKTSRELFLVYIP